MNRGVLFCQVLVYGRQVQDFAQNGFIFDPAAEHIRHHHVDGIQPS